MSESQSDEILPHVTGIIESHVKHHNIEKAKGCVPRVRRFGIYDLGYVIVEGEKQGDVANFLDANCKIAIPEYPDEKKSWYVAFKKPARVSDEGCNPIDELQDQIEGDQE